MTSFRAPQPFNVEIGQPETADAVQPHGVLPSGEIPVVDVVLSAEPPLDPVAERWARYGVRRGGVPGRGA